MRSHFLHHLNDDVRKQASSCSISLHIKWSQWCWFGIRWKRDCFSCVSNHRFTNKTGKKWLDLFSHFYQLESLRIRIGNNTGMHQMNWISNNYASYKQNATLRNIWIFTEYWYKIVILIKWVRPCQKPRGVLNEY